MDTVQIYFNSVLPNFSTVHCGKKEVLGTFWANYSENSLAQQERFQGLQQTKWRNRDHFSESLAENRAREESSLKLNIWIQTDIWHIRRGGACIGGIPLNIFSGTLGDGVAHGRVSQFRF